MAERLPELIRVITIGWSAMGLFVWMAFVTRTMASERRVLSRLFLLVFLSGPVLWACTLLLAPFLWRARRRYLYPILQEREDALLPTSDDT